MSKEEVAQQPRFAPVAWLTKSLHRYADKYAASQQFAETPVAPRSCQSLAEVCEPSIQGLVQELSGYHISDLQAAVAGRWALKYQISKVWRATDAISDKGIHSYLQHHWVIMQIDPAPLCSPPVVHAQPLPDKLSWSVLEQLQRQQLAVEHSSAGQADVNEGPSYLLKRKEAEDEVIKLVPKAPEHRYSEVTTARGQGHLFTNDNKKVAAEHISELASEASAEQNERSSDVNHNPSLTTETSLTQDQQLRLKPTDDAGLLLADSGMSWFLRVDRFNEADKWFACESFENALMSEQARDRHYSPSSELLFQVGEGKHPLFLDCLVPLLLRLGEIGYSIFAKGNHCQWHARVVTCIVASLYYFLDPCCVPSDNLRTVSPILLDGKEQQRYTAAASSLKSVTNSQAKSYAWERPEAAFLKDCIQDLKDLAASHPERLPASIVSKAFPDLHLIYNALQP